MKYKIFDEITDVPPFTASAVVDALKAGKEFFQEGRQYALMKLKERQGGQLGHYDVYTNGQHVINATVFITYGSIMIVDTSTGLASARNCYFAEIIFTER